MPFNQGYTIWFGQTIIRENRDERLLSRNYSLQVSHFYWPKAFEIFFSWLVLQCHLWLYFKCHLMPVSLQQGCVNFAPTAPDAGFTQPKQLAWCCRGRRMGTSRRWSCPWWGPGSASPAAPSSAPRASAPARSPPASTAPPPPPPPRHVPCCSGAQFNRKHFWLQF